MTIVVVETHKKKTNKKKMPLSDSIFRTRSLGTAASGLTDQYSDGKAAKVWQLYIGEKEDRTTNYKDFLVTLLREKKCTTVLDVACGTGVDSIMLLEEGFKVTSSDASDKMLKKAYKTRWDRRKEPIFDEWVIEQANWLTLKNDITPPTAEGFDAIICMGNSFAHLPDDYGDKREHILAIRNFYELLKPGGILIIDHRNYDYILDHGNAPKNNIYYNSKHIHDIKTSVLLINNKPTLVTLDYTMDVSIMNEEDSSGHFRLSYYPHKLNEFSKLLKNSFGSISPHSIYADFKPMREVPNPGFYIHVIEKME